MNGSIRCTIACAAAAFLTSAALSRETAVPSGLKLERVVLLMRHGVRAPTAGEPVPVSQPWPQWPVDTAHMTAHGEAAVRLIAAYDRAAWRKAGLLREFGCASVRVIADTGQRTTLTGRSYAAVLAPGCPESEIIPTPPDVDTLFAPIGQPGVAYDAAVAARAAITNAGPGGIAGEERRLRGAIARLDEILCTPGAAQCSVAREPSRLAPAEDLKRPRMTGALARASGAAQVLMLQYMDGWPMRAVGWGRVFADDLARLSALRSSVFRIVARPPYIARANSARLGPFIADALARQEGPRVTAIIGHDTNIASLAGLLGLHWQVPGLATDDPIPGGAIIFERLRDDRGHSFVRALYRAQSVDQVRNLTPLDAARPYVAVLPIAGCSARGLRGLCTEAAFGSALAGAVKKLR